MTVQHKVEPLLSNFCYVVDISIKQVSDGVSNGFVFEGRGCAKNGDIGNGGTQLSYSLTLENKKADMKADESDQHEFHAGLNYFKLVYAILVLV